MKSRCQSCKILSNRSASIESKSKEKKQMTQIKLKGKKMKKKYEIVAQPIRQSLRKNQHMVKQIQDKYKIFKDHVNMRQQSLMKEYESYAQVIEQLKEESRVKDELIQRLNYSLKQQQQQKINLSVDLLKARNQINVLKKQNDFYFQTHEEFNKDKAGEQKEKEFRQLKVAFKQLQKQILTLKNLIQDQ